MTPEEAKRTKRKNDERCKRWAILFALPQAKEIEAELRAALSSLSAIGPDGRLLPSDAVYFAEGQRAMIDKILGNIDDGRKLKS